MTTAILPAPAARRCGCGVTHDPHDYRRSTNQPTTTDPGHPPGTWRCDGRKDISR